MITRVLKKTKVYFTFSRLNVKYTFKNYGTATQQNPFQLF